MKWNRLGGFLLSAIVAAAQLPQSSDRFSTIRGEISAAGTGQPVPTVRVTLRPEQASRNPITGVSDDNGNFSIERIEPGRYRLIAVRNGYLRQEYGAKWPERAGTILSLQAGQQIADLVVRLTAQAVITGRVTDDRSEAVPNVNVQAMRYRFVNGRPQLLPSKGALSNDLGEYRIFGLAPGRYFVSAVAPGSSPAPPADPGTGGSQDVEQGFAPLFYLGATEQAGATPVEISGGQNLQGIDFRLVRVHLARVRGIVRNMTGSRPGRTMIRLMPPNSGMFGIIAGKFTSRIGPRGDFELTGVPVGSYVLSAESYEGRNRFSARQLLEVGATGSDGIKLVITAGSSLAGTIQTDAESRVNVSSVRVRLLPIDNVMFEGSVAPVLADGSFVFLHVAADSYTLDVRNLPPGFYLKSIRLRDQDVLGRGFTVPEGGAESNMQVLLSNHGGKVAGSVITADQQPASGAEVVLFPLAEVPPRPDLLRATTSDQQGVFSLDGIAPGKYRIFAFESLADPGTCFDPNFMKVVSDKGHTLELEEGGSAAVQLPIILDSQLPPQAGYNY